MKQKYMAISYSNKGSMCNVLTYVELDKKRCKKKLWPSSHQVNEKTHLENWHPVWNSCFCSDGPLIVYSVYHYHYTLWVTVVPGDGASFNPPNL